MGMTADQYLSQLQALLPPGAAWTREPDAVLTRLLAGLAEELARVDRRAADLVIESDPRTATEMISSWERLAGLPDACTGPLDALAARRDAVHARIISQGGQTSAFFITLAAALGYTVTITEFVSWTCMSPCDRPLCDEPWRFAWRVNAPETTMREWTCMSPCDEPLRSWGNELLECVFRQFQPAHTVLQFAYGT